jgi:hypothetical protein
VTLGAYAQTGQSRADANMDPLTCPILPDRQVNFALSGTRGLRAMTSFGVLPGCMDPTQLLSLAVKGSSASPSYQERPSDSWCLFSWNVLEQLVVVPAPPAALLLGWPGRRSSSPR